VELLPGYGVSFLVAFLGCSQIYRSSSFYFLPCMKLLSIKPKTGYLNRPCRRPRNRRLQRVALGAKWIEDEHEDEYEATDALICIIKF